MYSFHQDKLRYHNMTKELSKEYVIPFVQETLDLKEKKNVLEIGSGEAGVLAAFVEQDHVCMGIELSPGRVKIAEEILAEEVASNKISFVAKNIYDFDADTIDPKFDLIILKDVIEHIHEQEKIMVKLKDFLAPGGQIFFGFPPWYMPFGGHQQIAHSKLLSKLPYFHILPRGMYARILKWMGEPQQSIENLVEIHDTQISIERFERISRKAGFKVVNRRHFLFNPIYKWKFNIKPRKQLGIIKGIPFLRNFLTTCVYYTLEVE